MFYAVAASLILAAVVIAILAIKSRNGTLRRNWLAGTRLPATMKDDEAWEVAQRTGWSLYLVNAAVLLINGVGLIVLASQGAPNVIIAIWTLSWTFIVLVIAIIQASRSNSAARRQTS